MHRSMRGVVSIFICASLLCDKKEVGSQYSESSRAAGTAPKEKDKKQDAEFCILDADS